MGKLLGEIYIKNIKKHKKHKKHKTYKKNIYIKNNFTLL